MRDSFIYDRSKWHYDSARYPIELPPENAHVHIGFLLLWLLENQLVSTTFLKLNQEKIRQVKAKATLPGVFFARVGETLDAQMLNDVGNQFMEDYYDEMFLDDYWLAFENDYDSFFEVEGSFENYEVVAAFLSQAYLEWQQDDDE